MSGFFKSVENVSNLWFTDLKLAFFVKIDLVDGAAGRKEFYFHSALLTRPGRQI